METSECQPETAPQEMVTNKIGHNQPRCGWFQATKAGISKAVPTEPVKVAMRIPIRDPIMPKATNQNEV